MVTDQNGAPCARQDYLPFGQAILVSSGNPRYGVTGYGSSCTVRPQFTSKERDQELGNDFFGARYFFGAQGRFMSADRPLADQHKMNPQSWNLYA